MPSNSLKYQRANAYKYWENPAAKKKRAARNRARYKMIKAGKAKVGDGKHVDHVNGVGAGNGKKNLRVISAKKNMQMGAAKATRNKKKAKK